MPKVPSPRRAPRICVCVIYNHPFPQTIPIIRKLYEGRFSKLLFFMPFERMPDDDVITVYHGCYASPAYITESRHILAQIDCDMFMFVHDDVILNPQLSEANFREYFPLGLDDGFIPVAESPPEGMGDWGWYFGSVPRMLFPKSLLFSGGIEFENVYKYLPDGKQLAKKLEALGVDHKTFVKIDPDDMPDIENQAARVMFRGITRSTSKGAAYDISDDESLQDRAERMSLEAARSFVRAMVATLKADDPEQFRGNYIDLPYPLISTGYLSDFYILPKSKLEDFAHYAGVFTAANIWHETMVATMLFAICRRVFVAKDFGLSFAGFSERAGLEAFRDPDYMAIHPVKLSQYLAPHPRSLFLAHLDAIRGQREFSPHEARLGVVEFNHQAGESYAGKGWHGVEEWGRWTAEEEAELSIDVPAGLILNEVRLFLQAPLHRLQPELTATIQVNDGAPVMVTARMADGSARPVATLPGTDFVEGRNLVTIKSSRVFSPKEIDPAFDDTRPIGFGLLSIEFS